jgi:hypothetical protein
MNDIYVGETRVKLKTGPNHKGVVIGMVTGEFYLKGRVAEQLAPNWSSLFPNWENGLILYVRLDTPERCCTFLEFLDDLSKRYPSQIEGMGNSKLQEMYEAEVPFAAIVACPIEGALLDYDA